HEAGIHVAHAGACEHAIQQEAGEVFEVDHHHLQQVVHVTGEGVAGDDFVPFVHATGEVGHGGGVMVVQADADKGGQAKAQLLGIHFGAVAGDHTAALQPLHAPQAGGGRKMHALGQFGV